MATQDELVTVTDTNAAGPKQVTVDGTSVAQHDIAQQIALEKHRAANTQASSSARLIFNKISPPGAT